MSLCPKSPLKADIHEHDKFDAHDLESLVVATEEKVGRSKTEVCFKGIPRAELHRPFKILNGFLVLSDHRVRPHDFVLQRRIERAQELRRDPELALVDVALSVGFQTQAHFTTVFKRFAGGTPHRWRRLALGHHAPEYASAPGPGMERAGAEMHQDG
jgi:AraC-like DNA-binding protein